MKQLTISLTPESNKYKGHYTAFDYILREVAKFNGNNKESESDADKFIEKIFSTPEFKKYGGITIIRVDDANYRFGSQKAKEYVQYGEIIKINIL